MRILPSSVRERLRVLLRRRPSHSTSTRSSANAHGSPSNSPTEREHSGSKLRKSIQAEVDLRKDHDNGSHVLLAPTPCLDYMSPSSSKVAVNTNVPKDAKVRC